MPEEERESTISMNQECGVEARRLLGVLWPTAIYKEVVGSDPKPEQLTKITISGSVITGVLRDAKNGQPSGVVCLRMLLCEYFSGLVAVTSKQHSFLLETTQLSCVRDYDYTIQCAYAHVHKPVRAHTYLQMQMTGLPIM